MDPHRRPGDKDREQLAARIRWAHDAGLIGVADRDIRLGNVRGAQSMLELDLMRRELDQLQATLSPYVPPTGGLPGAGWSVPTVVGSTDTVSRTAKRIFGVVFAVVFVLVISVVVGVFALSGAVRLIVDGPGDSPGVPVSPVTEVPVTDATTPPVPANNASGPAYELSAAGVEGFLAAYRQKFGTSRVVDLVLYGDYAIVNVPRPKGRQQGWLYRTGSGWQEFGGVRARFPGVGVVDVQRVDLAALFRNLTRARRTLNVDRPAQAYVVIRFVPRIEKVPSVDIHLVNDARESGYLATTADGQVERAYPYVR